MAYDVKYPVDFRSGGDSVKVAFSKLIEEVRTIYGALNELAGDDFTDEQRVKLLASLTANIDGQRIIGNIAGNIDGSHVTGNIAAGQVSGELSGATIGHSKVTGLKEFVESIADMIIETVAGKPGYVKLSNGLIIQWGNSGNIFKGANIGAMTFPYEFTRECYAVLITYRNVEQSATTWCNVLSHTKNNFYCMRGQGNTGSTMSHGEIIYAAEFMEDPSDTGSVDFLAIGE